MNQIPRFLTYFLGLLSLRHPIYGYSCTIPRTIAITHILNQTILN